MPEASVQLEWNAGRKARALSPLEPCATVIFGGTGDLARRKVVPALYQLAKDGALPAHFAIVGVSRSAGSEESFRALHGEATKRFARTQPFDELLARDERQWRAVP
jgi:glucose-6-phosphate 1-dehydrogenase